MSEELEARIKALEDQLTPPPDKMSSMKATNRLKQALDGMKKGTQEGAVWWLIDENEKNKQRIERLEKELLEDECILGEIKTILLNGEDEKEIVEQVKKILGV